MASDGCGPPANCLSITPLGRVERFGLKPPQKQITARLGPRDVSQSYFVLEVGSGEWGGPLAISMVIDPGRETPVYGYIFWHTCQDCPLYLRNGLCCGISVIGEVAAFNAPRSASCLFAAASIVLRNANLARA